MRKLLQKRLKNEKGLTLIELLVIIVILGIIAAITIPMVMGNQTEAHASTNLQNYKILQDAVNRYAVLNDGDIPNKNELLGLKLDGTPEDEANLKNGAPFLDKIPEVQGAASNLTLSFEIDTDGTVYIKGTADAKKVPGAENDSIPLKAS